MHLSQKYPEIQNFQKNYKKFQYFKMNITLLFYKLFASSGSIYKSLANVGKQFSDFSFFILALYFWEREALSGGRILFEYGFFKEELPHFSQLFHWKHVLPILTFFLHYCVESVLLADKHLVIVMQNCYLIFIVYLFISFLSFLPSSSFILFLRKDKKQFVRTTFLVATITVTVIESHSIVFWNYLRKL